MSARDQGSRPSTIWTPRDHNLMANVDEPHGNRQQRISGVAVAGRDLSLDGHGCGRSHFRHRDRFVTGTRQLLGQRLRLLRQSGRQYALCGDQRADHRRRPVIQRRKNGRFGPACLRRSNPRATRHRRERPLPVLAAHPHADGDRRPAQTVAGSRALAAAQGVCAAAGGCEAAFSSGISMMNAMSPNMAHSIHSGGSPLIGQRPGCRSDHSAGRV
jgi:hypothetical protein